MPKDDQPKRRASNVRVGLAGLLPLIVPIPKVNFIPKSWAISLGNEPVPELSPKERRRRKRRNKIAAASRRRNRRT